MGQAKGVELKIWTEYEAIEPKGAGEGKEEKYFTRNEERRLFFLVERVGPSAAVEMNLGCFA